MIAIMWYMRDHFGNMRWELTRKISWQEYLQYSKDVSGEGTHWKGVMV